MTDSTFTLEASRWYSWHMLPGYGEGFVPYLSPILLQAITPLKTGKSEIELTFFNAFYAQGVQDFTIRLKITSRRSRYMVAASVESGSDLVGRDVIIGQMSFEWLKRFLPDWYAERPKDLQMSDHPLDSEKYLGIRFFGTEHPWRPANTL